MLPNTIQQLIQKLTQLSGVGEKTAQRYVFEILKWNEQSIKALSNLLIDIPNKIRKCKNCGNLTENEYCDICLDEQRDQSTVCLVENVTDLIAIEKTNAYHGTYYILNHLISIVDGVYPEDLNIDELIQSMIDKNIKEVILAFSNNIPGETTAKYISKKLENTNIKVTKLATGIPMGSNIEYADQLTLMNALEGRKKIE